MRSHFWMGEKRRRGSALVTVRLITFVMSLVFGAYIRFAMSERKSISRYQLQSQAQLAAESLANYAAAHIVDEFQDLPRVAFEDYPTTQLSISDSVKESILSPNIDPDSLEVIITALDDEGDETSGFERIYIDPDNPAYQDDPKKGQYVEARTLRVVSKATARYSATSTEGESAYVEYMLQLRNSPFLDYILFYNTDLEIMPEENMVVDGNTHSNGDIFVSSSDGLEFAGKVSAAGSFVHGTKVLDGEKFSKALADVSVMNSDGDLVSLLRTDDDGVPYDGTDYSHWIDNHPENTRDGADDVSWSDEMAEWDGYLKDGADQISLPGVEPYSEGNNDSYVSIEPIIPLSNDSAEAAIQEEQRTQQYSQIAGLLLKVSGNPRQGDKPYDPVNGANGDFVANTYQVQAFKYDRDDDGNVVTDNAGEPILIEVKLPTGLIGDANGTMDTIENDARVESFSNVAGRYEYTESEPVYEEIKTTWLQPLEDRIAQANRHWDKKAAKKIAEYEEAADGGSDVVTAELDQEALDEELEEIEEKRERDIQRWEDRADADGFIERTRTELATDADGNPIQATDEDGNPIFDEETKYKPYEYVDGGFYDYRENRYMDTLYLNVDRLREIVSTSDADYTPDAWQTDYDAREDLAEYNPADDWNGAIYVEVPHQTSDGMTVMSDPNLGVMLINGEDLPNQVKSNGYDGGFTFSTNGPVYLLGDYNADGDPNTGSNTQAEDGEVPALIVGETFTALSDEFADVDPVPANPVTLTDGKFDTFQATGRRQLFQNAKSHSAADAITPIEISAGLISGVSPTVVGDTDQQSGGAHNQIRFLQDWQPDDGSVTTAIYYRGSIIALFETEGHTSHLPTDYEGIFRAPSRVYTHAPLFKDGIYPMMPPLPKSFQRISVKQLYESEYQSLYSQTISSN
ncbi:MAG: hypothetical protein ACPGN3_17910 [Opitutales bacterium]